MVISNEVLIYLRWKNTVNVQIKKLIEKKLKLETNIHKRRLWKKTTFVQFEEMLSLKLKDRIIQNL